MRTDFVVLLFLLALPLESAPGQSSIPTFEFTAGEHSYTLVGRDPAQGASTTIPTVVVPISFSFGARGARTDATLDIPPLLNSPVFSPFAFPLGGATQFADAMLRATFPRAERWHTLLGRPDVMKTLNIAVPAASGYLLTSKKGGGTLAVVDSEFVQKELFKRVPKQEGKLVIAVTHNTAYYGEGDATLCCAYGTHGLDAHTGNSFVLASYLQNAPGIAEDRDVQPLTEQVGEFVNDPLHDPLVRQESGSLPGNHFPPWTRPAGMRPGDQGRCGGTGAASAYFLLEPTDTNRKNNLPASKPFVAQVGAAIYHVQNVALLPWYVGSAAGLGGVNSFPEVQALPEPSKPCEREPPIPEPTVAATPLTSSPNGHWLIGYWNGIGAANGPFPLREVSPQWDVVIVAFATPDRKAAEGTLRFEPPNGLDAKQFKADVAYLKSRGKKVMISLGGGGQYFTLADAKSIPNFVSAVTNIAGEYGFDGIDIDFESPSMDIDAGDSDFRHPKTPSIVNLIAALRLVHAHFGARFLISLVPEGTQVPAAHATYGGQFGSYLPIAYGVRDILSFMDVQDYNTPPLKGLDGEIYQAGAVEYHAAATELVLHGFAVAGDRRRFFPRLPAAKTAVGFLTRDARPLIVSQAMDYIIAGKAPAGVTYKLLKPGGYPGMIGAMFWTIDDDRLENYNFSNLVGPQLHGYANSKTR